MARIPVGILGATGMVGQRLLERLVDHPLFEVAALAASERSAGRPLGEAAPWRLPGEPHAGLGGLPVLPCEPAALPGGVRLVLSALDAGPAREIEDRFRQAGFAVVSNAGAWRRDPLVPLLVPEVNRHHLGLVDRQDAPGFIVTNPNCVSIPLSLVLAPLHRTFGVEAATVATWQAVSGAGYPGESAWDMLATVHPHPGADESKVAWEPLKILGEPDEPARFPISARCVRVPVPDGHLLSVNVRLRGRPGPEPVGACLAAFPDPPLSIPSSPRPLIRITHRADRPSTRFDVDAGGGMAVTVGRIEPCPVMGIKLFCLAHNTIRGAAGAAVANAELLHLEGRLPT